MKYILRGAEAGLNEPLGGKARALAALGQANLPIPGWVALRPDAFYASLTSDQHQALQAARDGAEVRALVQEIQPGPEVCAELQTALAELCPDGEALAVRSSASDEDGAQHSFAGQLDSFLFVPARDVPARVAGVWRSGFSERIGAYRREHGLGLTPRAPAVLIQRMVNADVAGVAFGADPVTGRRGVAVVAAVFGLGTGLVSGECDADTFHVDRDGLIIQRAVAEKRVAHRPDPGNGEGVRGEPLAPERQRQTTLSDAQVRAVADLVRRTGQFFGRPQDIEWAIEQRRLYLLQSRPITSLTQTADPAGGLNLWDNSNIAESYNGITTPLTFSFARRAYEEVYRQFCTILRVPAARPADNDNVFRHMLGLVRGRVYYNLLSWYRVLAMLPGYKANRRFMEQMMGVKEALPEGLVGELARSTWGERFKDRFGLLRSVGALIRSHFTLGRQIHRFYQRLHGALGTGRPELEQLRADELAACYRDLERQLLTRWDAPLVNDFFAMIFFGVLGKLTRKWCGDAAGTLQNDLLCGEGGMISAEPAQRVRQMAETACPDPQLTAALCEGSLTAIERAMDRVPEFRAQYRAYLDKFGDRCMEELKLESATLHDDPLMLLRSVGQLAQRGQVGGDPIHRVSPVGSDPIHRVSPVGSDPIHRVSPPRDRMNAVTTNTGPEVDLRAQAEARVRSALRFHPVRRLLSAGSCGTPGPASGTGKTCASSAPACSAGSAASSSN